MATLVGVVTSAVVMAAIPDSNGQINTCYGNSNKVLKVTDPAGNCGNNETALSWNQSGGSGGAQVAHLAFNSDGTQINSAYSSNITSFEVQHYGENNAYARLCVQVSFSPKFAYMTNYGTPQNASIALRTDKNGPDAIDPECGAQYNAQLLLGAVGSYENDYSSLRFIFLN